MKKTGQTAKLHDPKKSASFNADNAQYGDFLSKMLETLEGLEAVFTSENPAKEVREAMTDEAHPCLSELGENVGLTTRMEVARHGKIRESLVVLLKAINRRDVKFFSDMARLFSSGTVVNVADELRLELAVQRELCETYGKEPPTSRQLQEAFRTDRRTIERACKEVGLKLKSDKRGRPAHSQFPAETRKNKQP